ncbi:MAG: GNAT family N-acetyltransferase [Thermoplasmata archaeon]
MTSFDAPVTLAGRWIRLVPLTPELATPLRAAARDPEIGRLMLNGPGTTLEEMNAFISFVLERQRTGTDLGFATVLRADGRPIGMTRFLNIDRVNHSVEIGGTWLDTALWRTPVNTESKYLLLRHAFETESVHRVSLQTDLRNERAQRAIARIGAVREAVFRDDKRLRDGTFRTSVVYGILTSEWPRVKAELEAKLARTWMPPT